MIIVLTSGLALSSVACPIPHTHLKEPRVTFVARDLDGHPIIAAHVTIYRGSFVGGGIADTLAVSADAAGVMQVPHRSEWHLFYVPIPDAEAPWEWAWCVAAPGYRAVRGRLNAEPNDTVFVRLADYSVRGGVPCPAQPRSLDDVAPPR